MNAKLCSPLFSSAQGSSLLHHLRGVIHQNRSDLSLAFHNQSQFPIAWPACQKTHILVCMPGLKRSFVSTDRPWFHLALPSRALGFQMEKSPVLPLLPERPPSIVLSAASSTNLPVAAGLERATHGGNSSPFLPSLKPVLCEWKKCTHLPGLVERGVLGQRAGKGWSLSRKTLGKRLFLLQGK